MLFYIPPVSTRYTQTKGVLLSLDERVDIHTPEIRYMAHGLPIMSHAVGRDENKLRGNICIFIIKLLVRSIMGRGGGRLYSPSLKPNPATCPLLRTIRASGNNESLAIRTNPPCPMSSEINDISPRGTFGSPVSLTASKLPWGIVSLPLLLLFSPGLLVVLSTGVVVVVVVMFSEWPRWINSKNSHPWAE